MSDSLGHYQGTGPLERLFARFEGFARQMARQRGLAGDDVDEVVQDVRIRLWRARGADENPDALGTSYLMKVVATAVIDHLRRQQRARTVTLADAANSVAVPVALQVAADDGADRDAAAQRLARALAQLPTNRRVAVQLHLDGYTRDDIGRLTTWSEAKVRNLLYRGLDDLRAALTHEDDHGR